MPWKSSATGGALDVGDVSDDGRQPVDRDVFMRELDYYQIRAESLSGGLRVMAHEATRELWKIHRGSHGL